MRRQSCNIPALRWQRLLVPALLSTVCAVTMTSAPCPQESVIEAPSAPKEIDSLIWRNPEVMRFMLETLGDSQTVDYSSFKLDGASAVTYREWTFPRPPSENPGIWDFAADSSVAASSRGYEGEPDNILAVYNRKRNGKVEMIRDCGTPCQYLGVQWVDTRRFIFLMTYEHYANDSTYFVDGYVTRVVLYDVAADSLYSYKSSPVLLPGGRAPKGRN